MILSNNSLKKTPDSSYPSSQGYCVRCQRNHYLNGDIAVGFCNELMESLHRHGRIDFDDSAMQHDSRLSTSYLYGKARGKMFGVLVCRTASGSQKILKAFSGQYNGIWQVDGWAPPLFNVEKMIEASEDVEREIKKIGREIEQLPKKKHHRQHLIQIRRSLSQNLIPSNSFHDE